MEETSQRFKSTCRIVTDFSTYVNFFGIPVTVGEERTLSGPRKQMQQGCRMTRIILFTDTKYIDNEVN